MSTERDWLVEREGIFIRDNERTFIKVGFPTDPMPESRGGLEMLWVLVVDEPKDGSDEWTGHIHSSPAISMNRQKGEFVRFRQEKDGHFKVIENG